MINTIPWVNALDYPGSDLGAQINAADADIGAIAGTIVVPPGIYTISTVINLSANRTLHFSAGEYHCQTTSEPILFRDNTTIQGDGWNTKIYESSLTGVGSLYTMVPYTNSTVTPSIFLPGADSVWIKNLRITKAAPVISGGTAATIGLGNSSNVTVENVLFDHTSCIGLQIGGTSHGAGGFVQGVGGTFVGLNGTQLKVAIDGYATQTVTFDATCTTAAATAAYITAHLPYGGGTATVVSGQIKLSSNVNGTGTVEIIAANSAAGFAVTGMGAPGVGGQKAQFVTIRNCTFDSTASVSLAAVNAENFQMVDNTFKLGQASMVIDLECNNVTDSMRNFLISGNTIDMRKGLRSGGIVLASGGAKPGPGIISNNTFMGNDCYGLSFNYNVAYTGISVQGFNDVLIQGNILQGHWDQVAIYTYNCNRISILGNWISDSGAAGSGAFPGIRLGNSKYCSVMNNTLYAPLSYPWSQGGGDTSILEYNQSGGISDYNYFANNYMQQSQENYNSVTSTPRIATVGPNTRVDGNCVGQNPLGVNGGYSSYSANATILPTDRIINASTLVGPITLTLPDPKVVKKGWGFVLKNEDGSMNGPVTIVPHSTEHINNTSSYVFNTPGGSLNVYCNGTNWFTY